MHSDICIESPATMELPENNDIPKNVSNTFQKRFGKPFETRLSFQTHFEHVSCHSSGTFKRQNSDCGCLCKSAKGIHLHESAVLGVPRVRNMWGRLHKRRATTVARR
jgi:hypothetical protein